MNAQNQEIPTERCPICYRLPVFNLVGSAWKGGCDAHIPDAVHQPFDLYDQAILQWNSIVQSMKGGR